MADVRVASYRHEIQNGFARAVAADMAVAYATRQGLRFGQIGRELGGFLERGGNLRIVLDIELANTHPDFTQDISSGPHHQDSGEAKIRESTAGVSRKPSSDGT